MAFLINGFNIGQDMSLTFQDDFGDNFPADLLGHMTDFEATEDDKLVTVVPITNGGRRLDARIPFGYTGRITFSRVNGNFTNLFVTLNQMFYTSGRIPYFTLFANVLNRDGTINQYMFRQVQFQKAGVGNFRADKEVDMSVDFVAQDMLQADGLGGLLTKLANLGAAAGSIANLLA